MAHRAPLRNSVLWFVMVLSLGACHPGPMPESISLNLATSYIEQQNGIYLYHKQPFSGCLFALQENGRDTLFSGIFLNGKENGMQKKWYPGGVLAEQRFFENGLKTGIHEGFWSNGKRKFKYHFVNDLYEGMQYKWYEDGRPYTQKNYKNGQEEGMQQEWDNRQKLTINYQARNGRQYGNIGKKNCASMWMDSIYSKPPR